MTKIIAYYKGFHVEFESLPDVQEILDVKKNIELIEGSGYDASWNPETNKSLKNGNGHAKPDAVKEFADSLNWQAPKCGVHGTEMVWKTGQYKTTTQYHKEGDNYAFWSCPTKNADGSYCKFKPETKGGAHGQTA